MDASDVAEPAEQPVEAVGRYAARKAEVGRCVRCRAKGLPDDATMCPRCLIRHRKRNRKAVKALYRTRREQGLCARCGKVQSEHYRCAGCMVKQGRVPLVRDSGGGSAQDQWRRDGDGWARFRGKGKRGAPPQIVSDSQDLDMAMSTFERGRKALVYAHSPEVKERGRIQRKGAMDEAASILALVSRIIDDVVERNRDSDRG